MNLKLPTMAEATAQLSENIGRLKPSEEALDLAETLVNHQWGVSVYRLAVALDKFRAKGLPK